MLSAVTLSGAGTLIVRNTAYLREYYENIEGCLFVDITARINDTSGQYVEKTYQLIPPATVMSVYGAGPVIDEPAVGKGTLTLSPGSGAVGSEPSVGYLYFATDSRTSDYSYTTSNGSVATAVGTEFLYRSILKNGKRLFVYRFTVCAGTRKGTVKITATANDGTGKRCTFTVKVK